MVPDDCSESSSFAGKLNLQGDTCTTVEFRKQALGLYMLTSVIWWAYTRGGPINGWAYTQAYNNGSDYFRDLRRKTKGTG